MIRKKVIVNNPEGIHARPASALVKLASSFKSDFYIYSHGYKINGKSILGVLTLAAECGAKLELECSGEDEKIALQRIVELFERNFTDTKEK